MDKVLHFSISFGLTWAVGQLAYRLGLDPSISLWLGIGISLGIGFVKEMILDEQPDSYDLLADSAGVMAGGLVLTLTW